MADRLLHYKFAQETVSNPDESFAVEYTYNAPNTPAIFLFLPEGEAR
jgi:hypothetical protein